MLSSVSCLFPLNLQPTQNIILLEPRTLSQNNPTVQNLDSAITQIQNGDKIKPKKQSRLRKALFGAPINQKTQIRNMVNIIFQYLIMTLALCICLFGIRILYYLPLFLFFFSSYYFGLFVNRFGEFKDLSDPLNNFIWTIVSSFVALALFIPLRKRESTLVLNLAVCMTIVIVCMIGLYVFQLESKSGAFFSFIASVLMGSYFIKIGMQNLDQLLVVGSALIGSLIFVTNLQIAMEDHDYLDVDDEGFNYFVGNPFLYFLSVSILFSTGFILQKWQEKQQLDHMENSIAEIRNNISLD